jgi:hypothetical protein
MRTGPAEAPQAQRGAPSSGTRTADRRWSGAELSSVGARRLDAGTDPTETLVFAPAGLNVEVPASWSASHAPIPNTAHEATARYATSSHASGLRPNTRSAFWGTWDCERGMGVHMAEGSVANAAGFCAQALARLSAGRTASAHTE